MEMERGLDVGDEVVDFGESAGADIAAGELLGGGVDDGGAEDVEGRELRGGEGMGPHVRVHRGREKERLVEVPGAGDAGEEVVAEAVCELGEGVGAQGRDEEAVGPFPELDVFDVVADAAPGVPLVLVDEEWDAGGAECGVALRVVGLGLVEEGLGSVREHDSHVREV